MVILDQDGHCNVFDVSTDTQLRAVMVEMLKECLDHELVTDTDRATTLLANGSGTELFKFVSEEEDDCPWEGRRGGGRWYVCDALPEWKRNLLL